MAADTTPVQLKRLQVLGFKSLRDTVFEPNQGLSVLVGPNGAGKTNLLNAIHLLKSQSRSRYRTHDVPYEITSTVSLHSEYAVAETTVDLFADFYAPMYGGSEELIPSTMRWVIKPKGAKPFELNVATEVQRYFLSFASQDVDVRHHGKMPPDFRYLEDPKTRVPIQSVLRFNSAIQYYSAAQFTDPVRCPSSIEVEGDDQLVADYASRGVHRDFIYALYQTSKKAPEQFARYLDVVGKGGIGLISDMKFQPYNLSSSEVNVRQGVRVVKRKKKRTLLIPLVKVRQSKLAFNQLSEGTFKTLALIFYLLRDDWSMLLLEEPEVCIHHGLLTSLVELIKSRAIEKQVIVSTHSELVLDLTNAEQVFPVNMSAKGTKVGRLDKALSARELNALREYLRTSGNLGEYWKHGGLRA